MAFFGRLTNSDSGIKGYNRTKDKNLSTALVMRSLGDKTKDQIDKIIKCNEYYFHSNNKPLPKSYFGVSE